MLGPSEWLTGACMLLCPRERATNSNRGRYLKCLLWFYTWILVVLLSVCQKPPREWDIPPFLFALSSHRWWTMPAKTFRALHQPGSLQGLEEDTPHFLPLELQSCALRKTHKILASPRYYPPWFHYYTEDHCKQCNFRWQVILSICRQVMISLRTSAETGQSCYLLPLNSLPPSRSTPLYFCPSH